MEKPSHFHGVGCHLKKPNRPAFGRAYVRILIMTKLTVLLLVGFTMHVSASAVAQRITLQVKGASIDRVMEEVYRQSGYSFLADKQLLRAAKPVDLQLADAELEDALSQIFAGQPFGYELADKIITAKSIAPAVPIAGARVARVPPENLILAFPIVKGKIVDSLRNPLTGASIRVLNADGKRTALQTLTDRDGNFELRNVPEDAVLEITYIGFVSTTIKAAADVGIAVLKAVQSELEEVEVMVNTGYQTLPKERATGAFGYINTEQIERSPAANLLRRLEGMASGLQFVEVDGEQPTSLRVRGLSTIESDATPLIVIDNFPYHGNINNIDPNSIASVTILKDAAAASIWGAKAGNGVIVITTKQEKIEGRVNVQFVSSYGYGAKPDFRFGRNWLDSRTVMGIEKMNFENGKYVFDNITTNPLYVDYLNAHDKGEITVDQLRKYEDILMKTDTRVEAMRYLYRPSAEYQQSLSITGNTGRFRFRTTVSYNDMTSNVIGNSSNRLNLGMNTSTRMFGDFTLSWNLNYVQRAGQNNGQDINDLMLVSRLSPYLRLKNEDGSNSAVPKSGINYWYTTNFIPTTGSLDWLYRPMDEIELREANSKDREVRMDVGLNGSLWKGLQVALSYQMLNGNGQRTIHNFKNSYYVRDLANRFKQADGTFVIPHEGIMQYDRPSESLSHYGRAQLTYSYNSDFGDVNVLGGMDIRQLVNELHPGNVLYNYSDEYWVGNNQYNYNEFYTNQYPTGGRARIPRGNALRSYLTNRDLSYYFNVGYDYKGKYLLSNSFRWDASNLFGVKTNQKGVPLWSVGLGWLINEEGFYQSEWVDRLKLRLTYGVAGNINKTISHYPIIQMGSNVNVTTGPIGNLQSIGNPSLRWEKVSSINTGLDGRSDRLGVDFSIDYYMKDGSDLIGADYMDPTLGVSGAYKINYADIRTKGIDVGLDGRWSLSKSFSVGNKLNVSWASNSVTSYATNPNASMAEFLQSMAPPPIVGRSRDAVYAIPYEGLNPNNGLPLIYIDGEISDRYFSYQNYFEKGEGLVDAGSSVPELFGSVMPSLEYKGFRLSALFMYSGKYVFRRGSMLPLGEELERYHTDYHLRWNQPGDELWTNVARKIGSEESDQEIRAANSIYWYGTSLITAGDHIRLQDVSVSYRLPIPRGWQGTIKGVDVSAYCRNLGVVWRKNKVGLDPNFFDSFYRTPLTTSLVITVRL